MGSEIMLSELLSMDIIHRMEDMFSDAYGVAVQIMDIHGNPITEGQGFSDFCNKYTRATKLGKKLCEQCDKHGAERTFATGKMVITPCHAGLVDFTAPIIIDEQMAGYILSGQVLTNPLDEEDVRDSAEELGLDPDEYWAAAQKIKVRSKEELNKISSQLQVWADILSEFAATKLHMQIESTELVNSSAMKSDFLANMSHEIRTPMNAVIGMAEMALREEMTPAARDYIAQIKSSGKALLNIINDILDYSKIESGKMELACVEYEPLSLINDISAIVMTRLNDKPVELLLDVDPNLPHTLYGDDLRIRQILINLANNATKFTKHGHVKIVVRYSEIDAENILMKVSVVDTGIGIKKEDMDKLFNSFTQVDSKRNRNVEGTGLGLAITKNLVSMMNGTVGIESEYEVGSTFSFEIPQKVVEDKPSIKLKESDKYCLAGFFSREDVADDFVSDSHKLNVYADDLSASSNPIESLSSWIKLHKDKERYVVVDEISLESYFKDYFEEHSEDGFGIILLADAFSDVRKWNKMNYMQIIKKPFSVLNLAGFLESDSCNFGLANTSESESGFVAPDARILIVDDNAINLTVAEGLLKPLNMQIDTATSGAAALGKIGNTSYDIIFMDHMMPEMDGVETTRIIRRLHPECDTVPIIALTANAVSGTKEMFLSEGMNDFVAKPIEVRILMAKVRQWLPAEKIKTLTKEQIQAIAQEENFSSLPDKIGDLDVKASLQLLGSEQLLWKVYKDYYRVITNKADLIEKYYNEKDWTNYVVEVHALKSASKQIGAEFLSNLALELEAAGNARDIDKIDKHTTEMVTKYRSYIPVLAPYFKEEESDESKEMIDDDALSEYFGRMLAAIDDLDIVEMGNIIEELDKFAFPDDKKETYEDLKNAVADIDVDACEEIIKNWNN